MQMSQREANVLWLKDILEHLSATQEQLAWAEDPETIRLLTENMIRDFQRGVRLCESMRRRCSRLEPAM
jgi:hypothetical protein